MVQTITICTLKKNVYKSNDTHIHFNHSRLLIQEHTCGRHCSRARSNETYRQSADRPLSVSQGVYISSLRDPTWRPYYVVRSSIVHLSVRECDWTLPCIRSCTWLSEPQKFKKQFLPFISSTDVTELINRLIIYVESIRQVLSSIFISYLLLRYSNFAQN